MNVTVRYFAAFREATGVETEQVETGVSTTGELFGECRERHAGLEQYEASLVAVNDEMVQWGSPFDNGDEILFFPPVAGG